MVSWGRGQRGTSGPFSELRESVQPGPPPHHTVLGDKQENRFSHSGQFTSGASLSGAICQSLSLRAGWDGEPLTRLAVRAHWSLITLLESDWRLVQHHGQRRADRDKGPSPRFKKLPPRSSVSCFVPQKRVWISLVCLAWRDCPLKMIQWWIYNYSCG